MNAVKTASGHPVERIAFSPDGSAFATAQPHTGITLHDRSLGGPVRTFGNHRVTSYSALVFCNGGEWVASRGSRGLEVCETATGNEIPLQNKWRFGSIGVRDDRLIVVTSSGISVLERPPGTWTSVCQIARAFTLGDISPDGRWGIRSGPYSTGSVLDTGTGRTVAKLNRLPGRVTFAASADRFVSSDGKTVEVFDLGPDDDEPDSESVRGTGLPTGERQQRSGDQCHESRTAPRPRAVLEPLLTLSPPEKWPAGQPWLPPVALMPDGRGLLVRRPKHRVQLWDVASGCQQNEWGWRLEAVTCLAVAPDGLTAVAGGRFGKVVAWDLE